MTPRPETTICG
nr:unnamed protein product [Spodoptera littoralis]